MQSKCVIKDDRSNYAIADLVIQYLLYKRYNLEDIRIIIDYINSTYSSTVKKKADIYKKPAVITILNSAIKYLKKKNMIH